MLLCVLCNLILVKLISYYKIEASGKIAFYQQNFVTKISGDKFSHQIGTKIWWLIF